MADHILLDGMRTECLIGAEPEERIAPQAVRFSVDIGGDFSKASCTDNLCDAVDYSAVERLLMEYVPRTSYYLLEALAGGIAERIFEAFFLVDTVEVTITKEREVLKHSKVTVKVYRTRQAS